MPVIQGSPSQVGIQLGNPVGIGDENQQRMMGEAVSGVGQAIFEVGNKLDTLIKQQKEQLDRDKIKAAAEDYQRIQRINAQKAFRDPLANPLDDPDGTKAYEQLEQRGAELRAQIAEQYGIKDSAYIAFEGVAKSSDNQLGPTLMVESFKRMQQAREAIESKKSAAVVEKFLTTKNFASLDRDLLQVDIDVETDTTIMPSEKTTVAQARKRSRILGAITSLTASDKPDYGTARQMAAQYTSLLGAEEGMKLVQELSDKKFTQTQRELDLAESAAKATQRQLDQQVSLNSADFLMNGFRLVGEKERLAYEQKGASMEASGLLKPGTMKTFSSLKGRELQLTNFATSSIIVSDYVTGKRGYRESISAVRDMMVRKGKLDVVEAGKLMDTLSRMQESRNRSRKNNVDRLKIEGLDKMHQAQVKYIEALPTTPMEKAARFMKLNDEYVRQLQRAASGFEPDIGTMRSKMLQGSDFTPVSPNTTITPAGIPSTKQGLKAEVDRLFKRNMELEKNGYHNKEGTQQHKEYMYNKRLILERSMQIKQIEGNK